MPSLRWDGKKQSGVEPQERIFLTSTGKMSSIQASRLEGNGRPVASSERTRADERLPGGGATGSAARKRGPVNKRERESIETPEANADARLMLEKNASLHLWYN
jgi:hypothetical protein